MHTNNQNPPVTRALILAAGRGRRLRPYTDYTPKPLLRRNGRSSLDCTLAALAQTGVQDICLVTHYLAAQIEAFVGDGSRWGMQVQFRQQAEMLGTAHAVQTAVSFLTASCFILAADYFLPPDYLQALHRAYLAAGTPLAVSLKELPPAELRQRSSVRLDGNGRVAEIVEKPVESQAPSHMGASFIFIVPPAIRAYLDNLTLSTRQEYEFQAVINNMLRDGFAMTGLVQPPPAEWEPST